jgi:hypothetical protein
MGRRSGLVLTTIGLAAALIPACHEGDTITAPTLSAACSASPSEGSAPLEVAFALDVAGAEGAIAVQVSYGDGTSGNDPDTTHTYAEAGLYTASFTVTTASQSARCATPVDVAPGATSEGGKGAEGNQPPVTEFKTTPRAVGGGISGTAPFEVKYNICLTEDPEGDAVYFTMDLNGDGKLDVRGSTGASCRERWTYSSGTWFAELCVTDLGPAGERLHPFNCRNYTVVANP